MAIENGKKNVRKRTILMRLCTYLLPQKALIPLWIAFQPFFPHDFVWNIPETNIILTNKKTAPGRLEINNWKWIKTQNTKILIPFSFSSLLKISLHFSVLTKKTDISKIGIFRNIWTYIFKDSSQAWDSNSVMIDEPRALVNYHE